MRILSDVTQAAAIPGRFARRHSDGQVTNDWYSASRPERATGQGVGNLRSWQAVRAGVRATYFETDYRATSLVTTNCERHVRNRKLRSFVDRRIADRVDEAALLSSGVVVMAGDVSTDPRPGFDPPRDIDLRLGSDAHGHKSLAALCDLRILKVVAATAAAVQPAPARP